LQGIQLAGGNSFSATVSYLSMAVVAPPFGTTIHPIRLSLLVYF